MSKGAVELTEFRWVAIGADGEISLNPVKQDCPIDVDGVVASGPVKVRGSILLLGWQGSRVPKGVALPGGGVIARMQHGSIKDESGGRIAYYYPLSGGSNGELDTQRVAITFG